MDQFQTFLAQHWFDGALLIVSILLLGVAIWRWDKGSPLGWVIVAGLVASTGLGGFLLPLVGYSLWVALGGLAVLILLGLVLAVSGSWSSATAWCVLAIVLAGLGGLGSQAFGDALWTSTFWLGSVRPFAPWWLVLLVVLPFVVWLSVRGLAGLGRTRQTLAIAFRCLGMTLLILALAETNARRTSDSTTVLFLWDRSASIPEERDGPDDLRELRISRFISKAIEKRPPGREKDRIGLMTFGKWPRLEFGPDPVKQLHASRLRKFGRVIDRTRTDIGSAIKLALASFPEGSAKRIVLISDGNENLGEALRQATIAKKNGVEIDVVLLAAFRTQRNEVLVKRIEAPSVAERDSRLPLRVVVESHHKKPVTGTLTLVKRWLRGGLIKREFDQEILRSATVTVREGLNPFYLPQDRVKGDDSYIYEAKFIPNKLPGDNPINNRAQTTVVSRGKRSVLLIEQELGEHSLLVERLRNAKKTMRIVRARPTDLPQNPTQLALVLNKFDCIIMANVPAEQISKEQQVVIRSTIRDQGSGFVMIGGPNGFGAGGWQDTELEKALPVRCDLKSIKVKTKNGLVLIMHASEIPQGNTWQKKVAKLAVQKLSPVDMVGLVYWDGRRGRDLWHVPFQQILGNKAAILRKLDSMFPGDMMDAKPSMTMAYSELTKAQHRLGNKHIIFISDGDHWRPPLGILNKIKAAKITCTTVCITSHGQAQYAQMERVAKMTGGRNYPKRGPNGRFAPLDPKQLPAIYTKETRLISKSFIYEKEFPPILRVIGGPTAGLKDLPNLHGFVRTTRRNSPLVEVPIVTPKIDGFTFPLLAHWQYGLGRSVAFTSDAKTQPGGKKYWDHDWASSNMHGQFWEQVVEWALRAVEKGSNLTLRTLQQDGKVRLIVTAEDENKQPLTNVKFEAGVTLADRMDIKPRKIEFEQRRPGVYEAIIDAEDKGSYFFRVRGQWKGKDKNGKLVTKRDSVRAGVTVPYSPEFAEMVSNAALLKELAAKTGGKIYENEYELLEVANSGVVFRKTSFLSQSIQPLWQWLVFLAAIFFVLDIGVRRISLDVQRGMLFVRNTWFRIRRQPDQVITPKEQIARMKSRPAPVPETERKAFIADDSLAPAPSAMDDDQPATDQPEQRRAQDRPKPKPKAKKDDDAQDYMSRLRRARRKALEDREED
ncbi:MAG: VWA domain-containing protein [Gemmataceae bacterium]